MARRVVTTPRFREEFQALHDAGYEVDPFLFAVKRAVQWQPEAGRYMGYEPPIYCWRTNTVSPDERITVFYSFDDEKVLLLSIQRGRLTKVPDEGHRPPVL